VWCGVLAAGEHSTIIDARLQAYVTTSNVVVIYGWATLKARAVAHGIKTYAPLCARSERCSLADGTSLFFKVPLVIFKRRVMQQEVSPQR
jgi:hypothetical protein